MKFKKLISLGLAVMMAASLLTACGNTDTGKESSSGSSSSETSQQSQAETATSTEATESGEEIVFPLEETMEFTAMVMQNVDLYPVSDNLAWNTALDRANIKVELTEIPKAEVSEKGKLIMASGDYPDFLFKMTGIRNNFDSYGSQGILIPLEDLIKEYAPNLSAVLDERDCWEALTSPDGHIYSLPAFTPPEMYGCSNAVWWINKKWMDNLGLKEPTNMEELYQVLKAFKEQDANGNGDPNDEIPLTFYNEQYLTLLGYVGDGLQYIYTHMSAKDGETVFYPYTEGYKDFLGTLSEMYGDGLIDVNSFSQSSSQMQATIKSGDVVGMFFCTSPVYAPEANHEDYIALTPFVPDNFPLSNGMYPGTMAITDKCENPEVLIAWADYFYTEEGTYLGWSGVEGETWVRRADGLYEEIGVTSGAYEHLAQYALKGGADFPYNLPISIKADVYSEETKAIKEAEKYREGGIYTMGVVLPSLVFTEEENETLSILKSDIGGYVTNYSAKVIVGEQNLEDSWEDFQSTLKSMGSDDLQAIYQAAYDRAID